MTFDFDEEKILVSSALKLKFKMFDALIISFI